MGWAAMSGLCELLDMFDDNKRLLLNGDVDGGESGRNVCCMEKGGERDDHTSKNKINNKEKNMIKIHEETSTICEKRNKFRFNENKNKN